MAKRRRYTDEERAMLVVMLQSQGYTGDVTTNKPGALQSVVEYSGVPERTLRRWFHGASNPPPDNLVRNKKGELSDELEDIVWLMTGTLKSEEVIGEMSGKDIATSIGILVDKIRLLRGLPTEIVQVLPGIVGALNDLKISPADYFNAMMQELDDARRTQSG